MDGRSLLYFALMDSMERIKERVMRLLSLINPGKDIRRAWSGLSSEDPIQWATAIEFLDNLLVGRIKKFVFSLYSGCAHTLILRVIVLRQAFSF